MEVQRVEHVHVGIPIPTEGKPAETEGQLGPFVKPPLAVLSMVYW